MGFNLEEQRRLGRPSEEFLEKIRRKKEDEEIVETKESLPTMCGLFEQGSRLSVRIFSYHSIRNFSFRRETLTAEEFRSMKSALKIRFANGELRYAARPYNIEIGQIMLYHQDSLMHRCRIDDIYTIATGGGNLEISVDLYLIDKAKRLRGINLRNIFDFPNIISDLRHREQEAFRCSLAVKIISSEKSDIDEIDRYFMNLINDAHRATPSQRFEIEIIDFRDELYYIDIYNSMKNSIINHLRNKFKDKLCVLESSTPSCKTTNGFHIQTVQRLRDFHIATKASSKDLTSNWRRPTNYNGVIDYFKEAQRLAPDRAAYLARRLFKVRLLHWPDPESIHVVPDDQDYIDSFGEYFKLLCDAQQIMDKVVIPDGNRAYTKGEKCLFRNNEVKGLYEWLRGQVVSVPHINQDMILHHIEKRLSGENLRSSESVEPPPIVRESLLYGIKSIDYGFFCTRTPISMRPVVDEKLFSKRGPWSLPCKLYGVEPLKHNVDEITGRPSYTMACARMLDAWVRERTSHHAPYDFYIIFRSKLEALNDRLCLDGERPDVSLFHRYQPPYTLEDCITPKRRKARFDCLNWYLIYRGFASAVADESSQVSLDEWLINMLVAHDKIQDPIPMSNTT